MLTQQDKELIDNFFGNLTIEELKDKLRLVGVDFVKEKTSKQDKEQLDNSFKERTYEQLRQGLTDNGTLLDDILPFGEPVRVVRAEGNVASLSTYSPSDKIHICSACRLTQDTCGHVPDNTYLCKYGQVVLRGGE
jgi:hypothetical protein